MQAVHLRFIPHGNIRIHKWPAPNVSGFIAQLGIARSRVQTPLKSWIFQASLRNCNNCVHNCEDQSFIWFHIRSSYVIHFIYHFIMVDNYSANHFFHHSHVGLQFMSSAYRYFVPPCVFHSVLYSVRILYPVRSPCFIPSEAGQPGWPGWPAAMSRAGARFPKVPKLSGPFLGVATPSVSQKRRGFRSSNFNVILLFVTLKTCQKIGFPKQAVGSFTNGFSGPKSVRDFRETGPRPGSFAGMSFSPVLHEVNQPGLD